MSPVHEVVDGGDAPRHRSVLPDHPADAQHAHITEFDFDDDRNTLNYDALGARLFDLGYSAGAIHHSAGFDDAGVFRMYEVWASREHRARFVKETLQPLLAEGPADATHPFRPDREYGYELHTSFQ